MQIEFNHDGIEYSAFIEHDCDDGGEFVSVAVDRIDGRNMTALEERKIKRIALEQI